MKKTGNAAGATGTTLPKVNAKSAAAKPAATSTSASSAAGAETTKKSGSASTNKGSTTPPKAAGNSSTLPQIVSPREPIVAPVPLLIEPEFVTKSIDLPKELTLTKTHHIVEKCVKASAAPPELILEVHVAEVEKCAAPPPAREPEPEPPKAPVNINGNVKFLYEMYNESFPIENGSTTAANIDDVYCLSFVMPQCLIHLSRHPPSEKRKREEAGESLAHFFIHEEPRGTYQGLVADETYYVYVEQEAEQLKRDQQAMRERAAGMDDAGKAEKGRVEGCSCIYGNPCVDQYICKDWDNRFAVATKNGWKGF